MSLKFKIILICILSIQFIFNSVGYSQQGNKDVFLLNGLVSGYNHDPSKKILQKEKQIMFEGVLPGVLIYIYDNGSPLGTTRTNKRGEFDLKIPIGKIYRIEFLKPNYIKSVLIVDLRNIPSNISANGISFTEAEIILNSFRSKDTAIANLPYGKLFYNIKGDFIDFEGNKVNQKKGLFAKKEDPDNASYLMKRAVIKNKGNLAGIAQKTKKGSLKKDTIVTDKTGNIIPDISKFKLSPAGIENINENNISQRESEIEKAKEQLEKDKLNVVTSEDELLIQERERLLNAAIAELLTAKKLIELQKNEISVQRTLLLLSIFSLLILSGFLFLLYKHNKEKRITNILLKDKAKKITDSINYASRIQQSILLNENEIKKIIPQSFIYYEPRDIVSGDFYWFSEIDAKIIIAAVDCTGHGVPGAFMSLIGNTLLNEIVNEKHITRPSEILREMHLGILKALRKDTGGLSQDGMDISLCVIDKSKKIIGYAGAMNPIYLVKKNVIEIIKPDIQEIGGIGADKNKSTVEFTDHQIAIESNMSLYMFSDGYMDQFGGPENKKFNTKRFKEMLLMIHSMDIQKQKQVVEQTMKNWKGDHKQIDDMLMIGIKF